MTGYCENCGETICVCGMTADNKDAALALADDLGILKFDADIPEAMFVEFNSLPVYYNAARKPLEEKLVRGKKLLVEQMDITNERTKSVIYLRSELMELKELHSVELHEQRQQLLATQEAYQRVVEALKKAVPFIGYQAHVPHISEQAEEALANPPSLEALERKKLEDEIVVLEYAKFSLDIGDMIAERKAKLEKLK